MSLEELGLLIDFTVAASEVTGTGHSWEVIVAVLMAAFEGG